MAAGSATDNELPDINAIRRRNLRIVVDRAGSVTAFCAKLGVTRQRVHVLIRPHATRNIGDEFARKIETVYNLRKNWMDHVNQERSNIADAFEQIERDQVSHPDRIAEAKREVWRIYKDLGLNNPVKPAKNDAGTNSSPRRVSDVSKNNALRKVPPVGSRRKK